MFDQPIVERKNSSPLATSLLVVSAVCLIAASVFVGAQIKARTVVGAEQDPMNSATVWQKKGPDKKIREIKKLLDS